MKNLITYLKTLWSRVADSQSTDVSLDCRLTVGSPSFHRRSTMLKLVSVLAVLLTLGVGQMRGAGTTVTYAQSSSSAASVSSGTAPTGSTVTFSNSYSTQDQLTNGNSMALTLTGYKGYKITAIKLSMHSNSKQGSGTFSAVAGTTTLASISSNTKFNAWYDNTSYGTSYRDVNVTMTNSTYEIKKDEDVVITITCPSGKSNNSLYCQSFTITYEAAGGGCSNQVNITNSSTTSVTHGSFDVDKTGSQDACSALSVVVTPNPDAHYHVASVSATNPATTGTAGAAVDNGDGTYTITYSANAKGNSAISVTFEEDTHYTVTWMKNGSQHTTTEVYSGEKPTFPATPSSCDDTSTTFYGWATAEWPGKLDDVSAKTIYTSAASMPEVSGAVTYYAVFCKGSAGTEVLSEEFNNSSTSDSNTKITNETYSNFSGSTDYAYPSQYGGLKLGSGSYVGYITSKSLDLSSAFTVSIDIRKYGTDDANISVTVGSTTKTISNSSFGTSGYETCTLDFDAATSTSTVYITTEYVSSKYRAYIDNVVVTRKGAQSKFLTNCCTDPGLAYGTTSVTKTYGEGVFTNPLTNSHSVGVTYALSSVSPVGCVSINASTGQVTINGAGSATVTASFAGNATYCADEASYTLTVNKANITPTLTYSPNSVAVGENSATPTVGGNTGSGTVTYAITSASPAGCATINTNTGVVTGVAVGSVTVTATVAATDNYNGNTATATVTITAASNFPNGRTIFIQAGKSGSAWSDNACVVAWFHSYGGSETAQPTYWLFDVTAEGDDKGKKLFAAVVPSSGDLPYLDINRYASDCTTPWNKNGGVSYSDASGSNTIRSEGSGNDQVYWNLSGVTMELWSSIDSWTAKQADITDQGSGIWTGTISGYTPDATSKDFKIKTNYNGWIGNKVDGSHQNENATLSGMIVGSTYNITATLNVTDHSLEMSKTFVKGTVHFDMQEHGLAISDLTNVTAGSKISAPGTPSATGYDFGGWYKEPACTNAWNFGSDVVNETMTLYAKWTKQTYTITSTLNNCSSSPAIPSSYEYTGSAASLSYTITPSSGYRLPTDITVTGTTYTWNSSTGALVLTGTITSNVTITISAVQTHTVDWYVGGSAPANKIGDDGQTTVVDHGGKIEDFPATTPDGTPCDKTFVGWTNTTSYTHGTSLLFTDVEGSPTITADASFYAVFATGGDYSWTRVTSVATITGGGTFIIGYEGDYENNPGVLVPMQNANATATTSANGLIRCGDASNEFNNNTITMGSLGNHGGDDYEVIISEGTTSGTIAIQMADGNYIGKPTSGNNAKLFAAKGACTNITPVIGDDDVVRLKFNNDSSLQFNNNSSQYRFARYKNTQQDVVLYKKTGGLSGFTITCADCGTSVTPTYTASPTGGTVSVTKSATPVSSGSTVKTCTAVDLTVTLTPATHYDLTGFTATGLTTGTATITPAVGSTLPVSVAQTFTVTVSAGATGTLTLAPTFTAQTPLSITLETHSKGTFTPIGNIYSGESFTFPTVTPSDAECSSFLGWIEGTTWSGDGTETDPTAITGLANYHAAGSSSGTLTTTKTYTAVFGEKDTQVIPAYQKVTSAPSNWSGDYLIVRDANSRAFDGSLTTLDVNNNYIGVTISEGSITANSTVNASKWTIAKVGATSNYTIKSASGYYIGRTANSNGLNSSTSEAYTNTLSYSVDHVVITSSGGPTLQMNSGTRFRYYTTSQQALQLYKYNPDAEVVSYTYTTNPACTPRYRVTISSATGGSPEADKTYEHADETITITANPAAGYSFTSWTITKTTGGDNVTSTLLTGDKPTTANTTFTMPAYDITIAATYTKKMVSTLEVKDGATVVSTTTGPVSGTVNISTGANKTLDVVITPSDAYDHSWTATVSAGSTYASITNVTDDGFRVNGLAQGDATITVNAPNDGSAKSVTLTVQVRDIMPEEIILKRDGSNTPIETLIMYYDETNSKGQYVKVNVGYSPANPTNKAFTFSSALTGKVGSHSHAPASGYEVLVANGVTASPVNCTFTSSADGSVTKVLAVTVLPILTDRFVDYVHGNATQTVSARLSDDRYSIIPDINTPSLSDASDADPTSEDCETAHYHLVGWLPQTTAEALWAAGTPITDATEGLVRAGESVEATGQTWCAIWAEEQ